MSLENDAQQVLMEIARVLNIRGTSKLTLPTIQLGNDKERQLYERQFLENVKKSPAKEVDLQTPWSTSLESRFEKYEAVIRSVEFIEYNLRHICCCYWKKGRNKNIARLDQDIGQLTQDEKKIHLAGALIPHIINLYFTDFFDSMIRLQRERANLQADFIDSHLPGAVTFEMSMQAPDYMALAAVFDGMVHYIEPKLVIPGSNLSKLMEASLFVYSELCDWSERGSNVTYMANELARKYDPTVLFQQVPTLNEIENKDVAGYFARTAAN